MLLATVFHRPSSITARQEQVHRLVHPRGRAEHRPDRAAAVDEDRQADDGAEPGDHADAHREEVVDALGDADGLGPALRHAQAHHVAEEHREDPEVEQRAAPAQQAALVHLRRAGGPAELVVAVAPHVAQHEDRQAQVGDDHPENDVDRAGGHRRAPLTLGRNERVEADLLARRPLGRQAGHGVAHRALQRRQRGRNRRDRRCVWRAGVGQREPQQLEPGAVLQQQPCAGGGVDRGGELQHHARGGPAVLESSST